MRWLVVGGLAALVALIVLWRLTRDLTAPPPPSEPVAAFESTNPQAPSLPSSRDPSQPTRLRNPQIEPPVVRIPQPAPLDRPSSSEVATEIPDAPPDVGKAMRSTLRRQVDSIDPYISECVARANNRGAKISGRAALTVLITLDKEKGKVRVTEVGIEPIDTNIEDVPLLNCLRDAGKRMQLEDLPDGVTSIQATHEVSLDGGSITNHTLSAMEMLPAGAAPP
ncbi:MAG: hypothetical protein H0T79_17625 [Deltaproteobacteria bacterium]|nr:hypothetical protein [Deltaproteobacteria bacterium]